MRALGERVTRKGPRVRIPASPPVYLEVNDEKIFSFSCMSIFLS